MKWLLYFIHFLSVLRVILMKSSMQRDLIDTDFAMVYFKIDIKLNFLHFPLYMFFFYGVGHKIAPSNLF